MHATLLGSLFFVSAGLLKSVAAAPSAELVLNFSGDSFELSENAVPDDVPIVYEDGFTEIVPLFVDATLPTGSDIAAYLKAHNDFRAKHGARPLTWDNTLSQKAQSWANRCVFKHSGGTLGPYGENLAAGTGSKYDIFAAIKSWTDESKNYNPRNPQPSHFTQVVWKSSTHLGCAMAECTGIFDPKFGKAKYYVCEYSPAGNVIGHFPQNVQL